MNSTTIKNSIVGGLVGLAAGIAYILLKRYVVIKQNAESEDNDATEEVAEESDPE